MTLRAAIAVEDITPSAPSVLSGFASREGLSTGLHSPLTLRALVLAVADRKVAVLALDLIGPPDGLALQLAALVPPEISVVTAATHTHAGPPVLIRAMLGVVDPAYVAAVAAAGAKAIAAAAARLVPCRLAHRKVEAPGIAHNRRDRAGPVDHRADVVTLHDDLDRVVGLWVNFACHPVVLGPDNLAFSADFPGEARSRLEAAFGAPVVYTTGAAGQINLGHSALDSIRKVGLDRRTPAETARIGAALADAIVKDCRGDPPVPVPTSRLGYAEASWPAAFETVSEAARATIADDAARALEDSAITFGERRMAAIDLAWLAARPAGCALTVGGLRAGPLAAAFLPGEVFIETGLAIMAAHPGALVVGYAHTNPGYIPPRDACGAGGYEVDVAWRPYGAPGPFARGTAEEIERRAIELLAALRT